MCLQEAVIRFLETSTPNCIIYDIFAKLGISRALFSTVNAFTLFFFISPSIPEIKASYDPPTKVVMCLLYVVAWSSKLPIRVVKPSKRTSPKTCVFGGIIATHDAVSPKPQG
jgi:hypothetical protein